MYFILSSGVGGGEWWVEWARKAVATKVRWDYSPKVAGMPRNRVCVGEFTRLGGSSALLVAGWSQRKADAEF